MNADTATDTEPGTVTYHLETALEKTDDPEIHHHVRHALLFLGR